MAFFCICGLVSRAGVCPRYQPKKALSMVVVFLGLELSSAQVSSISKSAKLHIEGIGSRLLGTATGTAKAVIIITMKSHSLHDENLE